MFSHSYVPGIPVPYWCPCTTLTSEVQAGAIWFHRQLAVVEGWATEFKLALTEVVGDEMHVATHGAGATTTPRVNSTTTQCTFVLQDCSSQSYGIGNQRGGLTGVDDGLAVHFTFERLPSTVASSDAGPAATQWRVDVAVYSGDVSSGRCLSLADPACRLGGAVLCAMWDAAEELPVTVRYSRPTVTSTDRLGTLDVSFGYGEVGAAADS